MTPPIWQTTTERGFARYEFADHYGAPCSLQKSSLATRDCVWLGAGDGRMHLTQEMVAALLPALMHFAATGELP